jgi:5-methylthioadenosine/S-adenosylhomocysteine deaminase
LGIEYKTGSLSIGKSADIIAIDLDHIETLPVFDPISHVVYATGRHQVSDVWVEGKQLLKDRQLTTIDVDDLKSRVVQWQKKLKPS